MLRIGCTGGATPSPPPPCPPGLAASRLRQRSSCLGFQIAHTARAGASAAVVVAPEPEVEADVLVPRVLENRFGDEARMREPRRASPPSHFSLLQTAAAAAPAPPKPKLGLANAVGTLFSPVYNLFSGGAGEEEGGELPVECGTEEEMDLGELVTAAPASAEAEEEEEDFDPYLFISTLPPLHHCVPANRPAVLPRKARRSPRNTLVLDLDETLVHSTLEASESPDFSFPVSFNNQQHMVNVRRRPELQEFMERVGELFEVVIFTASQKVYAEQLLDIIDPGARVFRHRIFRDSCVVVDGNYLKDLTVLGRDLARTIIVDNSPQAFGFQLENGIPIESWFDDPADRELASLLPLLERLAAADDVRPIISSEFRLSAKVAESRASGRHA